MELLDIVNDRDEVVGTIDRADPASPNYPKRIVHVFVFDSSNRLLLQRRTMNVKFKPGAWATSACGHVHAGESYEQAALRETKEEIGLNLPVTYLWKDKYEPEGGGFRFLGSFRLDHDGPFTVDPEEVDRVEFFTLPEIKKMIDSGEDFHPETLFLLRQHFELD